MGFAFIQPCGSTQKKPHDRKENMVKVFKLCIPHQLNIYIPDTNLRQVFKPGNGFGRKFFDLFGVIDVAAYYKHIAVK